MNRTVTCDLKLNLGLEWLVLMWLGFSPFSDNFLVGQWWERSLWSILLALSLCLLPCRQLDLEPPYLLAQVTTLTDPSRTFEGSPVDLASPVFHICGERTSCLLLSTLLTCAVHTNLINLNPTFWTFCSIWEMCVRVCMWMWEGASMDDYQSRKNLFFVTFCLF